MKTGTSEGVFGRGGESRPCDFQTALLLQRVGGTGGAGEVPPYVYRRPDIHLKDLHLDLYPDFSTFLDLSLCLPSLSFPSFPPFQPHTGF